MSDRHPYSNGGVIPPGPTWVRNGHVAEVVQSLEQMRRGEGVVIACPDCDASLDDPGHRPGCPRHRATCNCAADERRRVIGELRAFADDLYGITGARWIADALTSTLDRLSEGDAP